MKTWLFWEAALNISKDVGSFMGQWLTKIERQAGQISIRLRLILTVFCISLCYINAEVLYAAPTSQPLVSSPLVAQTAQTVQAGVNSPSP
ncbi:MAG: hypothetical protein KDE46_08105, partial [Caldilineaceae bacterium]|nr:hypothetical protein [Caldilineaceae bacterium]